jgi:penicillin amidase
VIRAILEGTLGIIVAVACIAIAAIAFVIGLSTRSHPSPESVECGVQEATTILRNSAGFVHIVASTNHDGLYAQGWVHASDRLWQMEFMRRTGRGTLAEVLGSEAVRTDLFMRSIDLATTSRQLLDSLSPQSRSILESYVAGVNAYISHASQRLPFEFDALDFAPQPWTAEDCLLVGRLVAMQFSVGFWADVAMAQIASQRGPTIAAMYLPMGLHGEPTVLDTFAPAKPLPAPAIQQDSSLLSAGAQPLLRLGSSLRQLASSMNISGSGRGSNAWAVSLGGDGAIVANDPHLQLALPSTWYPVHITTPAYNVSGMSIPGLPLVISGSNDSIAWAVSSMMADDVDYFVERVDKTNPAYYLTESGGRKRFRYRRDTIAIRGTVDTIVDIRFTERSAVLSDVHLMRTPNTLVSLRRTSKPAVVDTSCITFRWTAKYSRSDEILALHRLATLSNPDSVPMAMRTWHVPAINITVGSSTGTVATFPVGILARRADNGLASAFFRSGWVPGTDWNGWVSASIYGRTPRGRRWVVAANNRLSSAQGPYVGTFFEPSSRAERIAEQLSFHEEYSARDAQVMQMDVTSPYARRLLAKVLPILRSGTKRYGDRELAALRILSQWDAACSELEPGAAIFATFLQRLIHNTFEDELGSLLYQEYCFASSIPTRRIAELVETPLHNLFDDVRTPQREDLSWIAIRSFIEAVQEVRQRTGIDDPEQWDWGMLHTVTLRHVFGVNPLLQPTVNHGPFPIGGMSTTVLNSEFDINAPFDVRVGASMRIVTDVANGVQYAVLPGGVSGQPLDANYSNLVQLWLKGGFVRLSTKRQPDPSYGLHSTLLPRSG